MKRWKIHLGEKNIHYEICSYIQRQSSKFVQTSKT